ncbi:ubiquinone biosynthesis methyltransferase UbiE [Rhizobium mayense]|uniref:Ubiquinone biosynthesis methyltransferase UbiE n=1 Tax=Rhizobium mayense TaxID=1312184 RepID=A0ABT7JNY8_9HYPH|nr:ubiquinone biosynthesis methyltransferase UbiE [Rhizobium mayense]MDL2398070.1 ubiquinone biosynthesis methyltransferase UbiE [Rhizobium mayense]
MSEQSTNRTALPFRPMLELEMEMEVFMSDWLHCNQMSNYVARMVSHDRSDPVRHANLLSSALNELFEISFRSGSVPGRLHCDISRGDHLERIALTFPCTPEQRHLYRDASAKASGSGALESYLDALADENSVQEDIILLGLAINYDASLSLREVDGRALTVILDIPVEGLLN